MKTSDKHNDEEAHTEEHKHEHHEHTERAHEHLEHVKHEIKKEEKARAKKSSGVPYLVFGIIIVLLLGIIIALLLRKPGTGPGTDTNTSVDAKDKVKVEFYVMSQCPYGTQVEAGIAPVIESMGGAIDFHVDYIASEPSVGTFQSLHGEKEVKGNIAQLCAKKYYPEDYKWFDFIICQNKDASNVDTNWATCAQENGMDSNKLKTCLDGEEGKTLLRESISKANARQASGSPTMFIGDVAYNGGRDAASFQRAICQYSKSTACANLPKCATDDDCTEQPTKEGTCVNPGQANAECAYTDPVPVELIIVNDEKCGTACDTTRIVQVSQQLFLGVKPRVVDVSSEEGKALVEKYKIEIAPAYIYDKNVVETKSWKTNANLQTAFEQLSDGSYKLLDEATGATYFVSEEARKAYYDAIGVVKGDNKPQIDFFVMSYCPYGNQADEAIEPVYQLLKDKAIFNPRYVIYSDYAGGGPTYCIDDDKLCSMHGIQELNQDVREICVNKYMGIGKWFEFALAMNDKCTSQNADTCWEAVATDLKLDVAKIKTCQKDEAVALLTAEKTLGDKLKVSGSPTVFIDGDSYSGGRTPEAFKTALCDKFDTKPSECSTTLAGAPTTAAATATGSC